MDMTEIEFEQLILDISNISTTDSINEQINHIQTKYSINNIEHIFTTLNKLNKNKLKVIQKNINTSSQNVKKEKIEELNFLPKKNIEHIFKTENLINIEKKYTKKEIEGMYFSLIGTQPLSSYNKNKMLKNIDFYFKSHKRVKDIETSYQVVY